jgi:hypothetical protein
MSKRPSPRLADIVSELVNALQTVTLLSTKLRQELGGSTRDAVALEAAADRAVQAALSLRQWTR